MILYRRADFGKKRIRQGGNCADAFIHDDFLYAVEREENRCGLNSVFLAMCDVIHPIFKSVEIDSANRYARRTDFHKPAKEPFPRVLQIHNDDRIHFHSNTIVLISPSTSSHASVIFCTSSSATSARSSFTTRPWSVTRSKHSSVTIVSTTSTPVS